jgi:hypothetical protein
MSLFKKCRENYESKKQNPQNEEEVIDSEKEVDDKDIIKVNQLTFERCNNMDKIKDTKDLSLLPLQCLLNHFILKHGYVCYYICVENDEVCDAFEIYEFEYSGECEEEYRMYEQHITGSEYLKFLLDKISNDFDIYIQKT